jgi:hypothetical protein
MFLPNTALLYKIQRDGNRLHKIDAGKFRRGLASGVGALASPIRD